MEDKKLEEEIKRLKITLEQLKNELFERIKKTGIRETARQLDLDHGYLSRIVNGKDPITFDKIIDMLEKIIKK